MRKKEKKKERKSALSAITNFLLCFDFLVPGSLHWRTRNALLGSVLGAAFGFPLGNYSAPVLSILSCCIVVNVK